MSLSPFSLRRFRNRATRCLVLALIMSLCLPVRTFAPASARADDPAAAHVIRRLNSPEREAAVAEMAHRDAAMQAAGKGDGSAASPNPEKRTSAPAPE